MTFNNEKIRIEFRKEYVHLINYGLEVIGIVNLIDEHYAITISTPFIFDRRKLPIKFMGLPIRGGTPENELPAEFRNVDKKKEYIWAYQRFENYVTQNQEQIRNILKDQKMTREDMLDALCFGDFQKHKQMCIQWEKEGKIPKWI